MAKKKSPQGESPKLWERQEEEGPQAFRAFVAYRDSGADGAKRSLQKTAQSLTKSNGELYSVGTLKEWSRKWGWQKRVDAFDDYLDRQSRLELEKGITEMRKNHANIAKAMLVKALKALQKIPDDEMTPRDVVSMVDVAAKLERISRGEATEKTESKTELAGELKVNTVDLSLLSDDELEALNELADKVAPN